MICTLETIVLFAVHTDFLPHRISSMLCLSDVESCSNIRITPAFVLGSTLLITGGQLRLACYRTMGRFFTFELSLRSDHALCTSFPYSIIRHPSYTGLCACMLGEAILLCCNGSWLRECGWLGTVPVMAYFVTLVLLMVATIITTTKRTKVEDKMLKERFGAEWETWAKRTPYSLIPYIY